MASEFPQHWSSTLPSQTPTTNGDANVAARPLTDFKDKVAVITGGATGIGFALAKALAAEDSKVVIASTNQQRLLEAAKEINDAGGQCLPLVCDVSSPDSVKNLYDTVKAEYSGCDLLFCNAGVTTAGSYLDHRPSDWDWVYSVVLGGVVNCIQLFYPDMCQRKSGQIILTGRSVHAL